MPDQMNKSNDCVTPEEVKAMIRDNKRVQIIDVRSREEYSQAHITDARHIALQDLEGRISQLDPEVLVVTACGKGGGRSAEGAALLRSFGLNARWLCGGTNGWLNPNPAPGIE